MGPAEVGRARAEFGAQMVAASAFAAWLVLSRPGGRSSPFAGSGSAGTGTASSRTGTGTGSYARTGSWAGAGRRGSSATQIALHRSFCVVSIQRSPHLPLWAPSPWAKARWALPQRSSSGKLCLVPVFSSGDFRHDARLTSREPCVGWIITCMGPSIVPGRCKNVLLVGMTGTTLPQGLQAKQSCKNHSSMR